MGRSVADAKVAFEVMAGPDPRDPHSVALLDVPPPSSPRIAVSPRLGLGVPVDPDVIAAFETAVAKLRAAGWRIEEADVTWPEDTSETAFAAVNSSASALLYGARQAADKTLFGENISGLIERGRSVPGTDVVAAFRFADACARSVAQFFTEYDYLLTPTTSCVSWPVEQVHPKIIEGKEVGPRGHAAFTPLFNLALVPAISVPCGSGRDGLHPGQRLAQRVVEDHVLERHGRLGAFDKRRRGQLQTQHRVQLVDGAHAGACAVAVRLVHQHHEVIQAGQVVVGWTKQGMDGLEIHVDRGDGKGFVFLAIDTVPDYTDTAALPAAGQSALWKYKAIYLQGDSRVGQWSDVVSIPVAA